MSGTRLELRVSHGGAAWSPVALPQQGALFLASEQQEGEKEATGFYLARMCRDDDTRAAEREAGEGDGGWGVRGELRRDRERLTPACQTVKSVLF